MVVEDDDEVSSDIGTEVLTTIGEGRGEIMERARLATG